MRVLSPIFSSRHFCAVLRTATASRYTRLHVSDALTILGALSADFRALSADVLVMLGTDKHEMCRRPADFCASHHQLEMLRLGMPAAHFEAVIHGCRKTFLVAGKALLDARCHL
ncbi:UNVERIFIED_ORG: hypothetical protein J2W85_002425 [Ensifer adhaerens]|nr:hypothetical protein [Ensifer adhaerens]